MPVLGARTTLLSLAALVLFDAGVGVGWLLRRNDPTPRALAAPLGETDVAVERTRAGDAAKSSQKQRDPSASEIARRALAWTVFLRGGSVYGAGVLLDDEGHVLTCDHVIDGLKQIDAYFDGNNTPIPLRIVKRDHAVDLALLKLESVPASAKKAPTASIADVAMGDEVFALGAPRKMTFSMSHGIVSYVGRAFDGTYYVQTDLAANDGSSGGPVMNHRGELIGVSSFIVRGSQGLTFAVPIDYAYARFAGELGAGSDAKRFKTWLATREARGH